MELVAHDKTGGKRAIEYLQEYVEISENINTQFDGVSGKDIKLKHVISWNCLVVILKFLLL